MPSKTLKVKIKEPPFPVFSFFRRIMIFKNLLLKSNPGIIGMTILQHHAGSWHVDRRFTPKKFLYQHCPKSRHGAKSSTFLQRQSGTRFFGMVGCSCKMPMGSTITTTASRSSASGTTQGWRQASNQALLFLISLICL